MEISSCIGELEWCIESRHPDGGVWRCPLCGATVPAQGPVARLQRAARPSWVAVDPGPRPYHPGARVWAQLERWTPDMYPGCVRIGVKVITGRGEAIAYRDIRSEIGADLEWEDLGRMLVQLERLARERIAAQSMVPDVAGSP